jgi:phasin
MISLENGVGAVSDEVKADVNGTSALGTPLFGFPKIALFGELAEEGVARAQESCEKIKAASEQMAQALRETCSSNGRSATDYGLKVIEISNANTASAIDFFTHLLGSKSMTDVVTLSTTQARKALDTASSQNKELWELGRKLAAETGEPFRKHAARVFHLDN